MPDLVVIKGDAVFTGGFFLAIFICLAFSCARSGGALSK